MKGLILTYSTTTRITISQLHVSKYMYMYCTKTINSIFYFEIGDVFKYKRVWYSNLPSDSFIHCTNISLVNCVCMQDVRAEMMNNMMHVNNYKTSQLGVGGIGNFDTGYNIKSNITNHALHNWSHPQMFQFAMYM